MTLDVRASMEDRKSEKKEIENRIKKRQKDEDKTYLLQVMT